MGAIATKSLVIEKANYEEFESKKIEFKEIEFELEELPQFADLSDLITLSSKP